MNANELADVLMNCHNTEPILFEKAATMLRQLQAENETIKTQYEELKRAYMILSGKLSDLSCGGGAYSSHCCCNKQQLGGGGGK